MRNKLLISIISISCLFVSCKKQEGEISNQNSIQIGSNFESILNSDKNSTNKVENLKNEVVDNSLNKFSDGFRYNTKSKKVKKRRKKLLSGITPLTD